MQAAQDQARVASGMRAHLAHVEGLVRALPREIFAMGTGVEQHVVAWAVVWHEWIHAPEPRRDRATLCRMAASLAAWVSSMGCGWSRWRACRRHGGSSRLVDGTLMGSLMPSSARAKVIEAHRGLVKAHRGLVKAH